MSGEIHIESIDVSSIGSEAIFTLPETEKPWDENSITDGQSVPSRDSNYEREWMAGIDTGTEVLYARVIILSETPTSSKGKFIAALYDSSGDLIEEHDYNTKGWVFKKANEWLNNGR